MERWRASANNRDGGYADRSNIDKICYQDKLPGQGKVGKRFNYAEIL